MNALLCSELTRSAYSAQSPALRRRSKSGSVSGPGRVATLLTRSLLVFLGVLVVLVLLVV